MRSEPLHSFTDHAWQVASAEFSTCSEYLVTGGWDKSVTCYEVSELRPLFKITPAHSSPITCVKWMNRNIVTCSADRTAALWDTSNGLQMCLFTGHSGWVMSCDITDSNITTVSWDNTLAIWDPHRPTPLATMSGHVAGVWDCASLQASQVVASASEDCTLRLWDRRTASCFATLAGGHQDSVLSVCWPAAPDFVLASGSTDCSVLLWDTRTCKPLTRVESHTNSVKELVLLPHQPGVIASIGDNTLKIWDTSDTTNIKMLGSRCFPTDLECVAVSPDLVSHVCGGVNSTTYLSLFVGVDDDTHQRALDRYTNAINRLNDEDSATVSSSFSRPQEQTTITPRYIPRESPRDDSCDATQSHSVTLTSDVTDNAAECKRESSCSDSGVDVTSLSVC